MLRCSNGNVSAAGVVDHVAVGVARVHVDAVAQRVLLYQQPTLFARIAVDDVHPEPERAGLEAERGIAIGQGGETAFGQQAPGVLDRGRAAGVMQVGGLRCQRQVAGVVRDVRLRRGRGTQWP